MKVELFPFQKMALFQLRRKTAEALGSYQRTHTPQVLSFTAPTGAGKTIILASLIESIYFGDEEYPDQPDAIFVWLSDSPELNEQSRSKIDLKADKIRLGQCATITDESFDQEMLDDGHIYFLNTQKLGKSSNLTKKGDGRTFTIWETLQNTMDEKYDRLYFIIDEAHRGMQGRAAAQATTIMQKFLKGSREDRLAPVPVVLGVTATPERFNNLVSGTESTINYDLPWNPMRIEQRIGRIDRRGQGNEVVNIYNIITSDTVDADIYDRCLSRIGVFEGSIGECEEILGEIGRQIELIALDTSLTDAERKAKLEQMADNEVRKAQELNKLESEEKELFGFDLSNYTMSKEIQEAESPFLSARSIQHLVEMYLNHRLGGNNYILGDGALKTLRLSAVARSEILSDLRNLTGLRNSLRRKWEVYLKGNNPNHPITFDSEAAEKNRTAFFVTPMHPLVKQAASYFATNKLVYIHLEYYSDEIPAGDYPMSIYAWDYVGIRSNFKLVAICEEPRIAAELPEYILTAAAVDYSSKLKPEVWDALEEHHVQMWQAEKAQHTESTRQVARYKLESIKNNYRNRKLFLERKIAEAGDERIATMHRSELENATQRYQQKVSEIEAKIAKADIHTTLIANGVITVK